MEKKLEKAKQEFDEFDKSVKELTLDQMNKAPLQEQERQTKLSSNEMKNSKDIYLKPKKTVRDNQKFNEKFREDWNFKKEYVQFIAEHKELIGETIELWTHPFGGVGGEFWEVPTNTPVWGPRYLAEQIASKQYHRLIMQNTVSDSMGGAQFYGTMAADSIIKRMDAYPVSERKSQFRSGVGF